MVKVFKDPQKFDVNQLDSVTGRLLFIFQSNTAFFSACEVHLLNGNVSSKNIINKD
ncbi:hypothetical protein [Bdellovibrio sp. HCB-162]|uniref:hypothetical protein n=1 Tax=Bdellovibrio sp. HCB-162 TaxID=3394234 RepID=UPI0039BD2100